MEAGAWLPLMSDPKLLGANEEAVRTGEVVVSDFFTGKAVPDPLYSVRKAVRTEDGRWLVVILSRPVEHLSAVLKAKQLPEGAWATLVDREGVIVARTIAPETIGRKLVPAALEAVLSGKATSRQISPEGVANFGAYQRVEGTGWTVAVAMPEESLLAPMMQSALGGGLLVLLASALAVFQGVRHGRRIAGDVGTLKYGAIALGNGEPLPPLDVQVLEMQEIAAALTQAARRLDEKHLEQERTEVALRQAKSEAERAVDAKSRFLAAASHDLRQPLQALALYQSVLRPMVQGERASVVMDNAEACTASLTALLNDMLDVSKFDAGAVVATPGPVSIGDLLDDLVKTHQAMADAKGLDLRYVRSGAVVQTDEALLRRILLNFLTNAIRYTAVGKVLLGCRRQGGKLVVGVWDTGSGIPQAEMSNVFEEFYQLGNPERSRAKGTGLGLSIVKRAAHLLDAPLRVRSEVARGSMFAVELPLVPHLPSPLTQAEEGLCLKSGWSGAQKKLPRSSGARRGNRYRGGNVRVS